MNIPYVTFMKHAEKVTKGVSASRPILQGVQHKLDGSLVVTDSHRLYIAKNGHTNESESVVNPKTGEAIDGNYPDVSRLTPLKDDAKLTVSINVKQAVDALNTLLKANQVHDKKKTLTTLEVTEDKELVFIVSNDVIDTTYKTSSYITGEAQTMTFNTKYLIESLQLFKEVGIEEVELRSYGTLRPFTLTAGKEDELLALILPVRTV